MAAPAVHPKTAVDKSKLSAYINHFAEQFITQMVNSADFIQDVKVDRKVTSGKKYPKIVFKSGMKPYTGVHDPEPGKIILSDRGIEVSVGQDDFLIDPEVFRYTFMEEMADISGKQIPQLQLLISGIVEAIMAAYNDEAFFFGDPALGGTNKILLIHDGLRKQIRTLRTTANSGIHVVPTGVLTGGSGHGATAEFGNVIDSFFKVWKGLPLAARRRQNVTIYCSEKSFDLYAEDYRRKYGIEKGGEGDPRDKEIVYLDGSKKKCVIKCVSWMGDSPMLICTPKENIVWGTDIEDDKNSKLSSVEDVYTVKMGWKLVAGICIPDPEAMSVNELDAAA